MHLLRTCMHGVGWCLMGCCMRALCACWAGVPWGDRACMLRHTHARAARMRRLLGWCPMRIVFIHACVDMGMVRCGCMHGMRCMCGWAWRAYGGHARARTHAIHMCICIHMHPLRTCMHGVMRMDGASPGCRAHAGLVPHGLWVSRMGVCHVRACMHAHVRTRGGRARMHHTRAASAPWVMDIMHGYVPHACMHARTRAHAGEHLLQRTHGEEGSGCWDGASWVVGHVCICIACTCMHATYTCAWHAYTCTCVTHLETTQRVGAACMST